MLPFKEESNEIDHKPQTVYINIQYIYFLLIVIATAIAAAIVIIAAVA